MTGFATTPSSFGWNRALLTAFAVNFLWINLSEVFRYFVFVMPMMRDALPGVPDVAAMSLPIFLIWGVWDTVLVLAVTLIAWLALDRIGHNTKSVVVVGTGIWATVFVILWLGLYNMGLATPAIVMIALPLAWFEMVIATAIVRWAMTRDD